MVRETTVVVVVVVRLEEGGHWPRAIVGEEGEEPVAGEEGEKDEGQPVDEAGEEGEEPVVGEDGVEDERYEEGGHWAATMAVPVVTMMSDEEGEFCFI